MNFNRYLTNDIAEMEAIEQSKQPYRTKCNCGVTIVLVNADRKICYRCGHWIYRNDKVKFRYEMMKKLREAKYEYSR